MTPEEKRKAITNKVLEITRLEQRIAKIEFTLTHGTSYCICIQDLESDARDYSRHSGAFGDIKVAAQDIEPILKRMLSKAKQALEDVTKG